MTWCTTQRFPKNLPQSSPMLDTARSSGKSSSRQDNHIPCKGRQNRRRNTMMVNPTTTPSSPSSLVSPTTTPSSPGSLSAQDAPVMATQNGKMTSCPSADSLAALSSGDIAPFHMFLLTTSQVASRCLLVPEAICIILV